MIHWFVEKKNIASYYNTSSEVEKCKYMFNSELCTVGEGQGG